jgi:hypothetical protein
MWANGVPITFGGQEHRGWLPNGAAQPRATPTIHAAIGFRILETSDGYSLEWGPEEGESVPSKPPYQGDTWHQTLAEALAYAQSTFGLLPGIWKRV